VPRRWEAHHDPLETPQCHFTRLVGCFLIWCAQQGYAVALKEVQLTHEQQALYVQQGKSRTLLSSRSTFRAWPSTWRCLSTASIRSHSPPTGSSGSIGKRWPLAASGAAAGPGSPTACTSSTIPSPRLAEGHLYRLVVSLQPADNAAALV
jgi:hypothetical protein